MQAKHGSSRRAFAGLDGKPSYHASWARYLISALVLVVSVVQQVGFAQQPANMGNANFVQEEAVAWQTGKQLERSLQLSVAANWTNAPLRDVLQLSKQQRVAVIMDRRLDPTQKMNFSSSNITFEQLLWRLGDIHDFGVCRIEDAYYIGPKETAAFLPALLELTKGLKQRGGGRNVPPVWRDKEPLAWDMLATPQAVLDSIGQATRLEINNKDLVPHDLWPSVSLPPMSLEARMGLALVGFDLWFQPENAGSSIKIRSMPSLANGTETLRGVVNARKLAGILKKKYSDCKFSATGKSIKMTGPVQTLMKARKDVAFSTAAEIAEGSTIRYKVDHTASRKGILQQLGGAVRRRLEYPESAEAKMEERIKLKADDKTLEEIIAMTLEGTGLGFSLEEDGKLIVK